VSEPANTVRAVPFIPGRRSSSGNSSGDFEEGVWALAKLAAKVIRRAAKTRKRVNLIINNLRLPRYRISAFSYRISGFSRFTG
jgi:hypothetical protein